MMGILDALQGLSANPATQQGLLAAGLGMLAANQGGTRPGVALGQGGLLGMNAYSAAKQNALAAQLQQQQIEQANVETQVKQQQLAMAQRQFEMSQGVLQQMGWLPPSAATPAAAPQNVGGSALSGTMAGAGQDISAAPAMLAAPAAAAPAAAAPAAAAGPAAGPAAGGVGGAAPGTSQSGQPTMQPQGPGGMFAGLNDDQRRGVALNVIGMKDVASYLAPEYDVLPNGIQINKKTGQPTGQTFAVGDPQGHFMQMVPTGRDAAGNIQFGVAIPTGALPSFTQYKNAEDAAAAGWHLGKQIVNGKEVYVTDAGIISQMPPNMRPPGFGGTGQGGAPGGTPGPTGGQPGPGMPAQGGPQAAPQTMNQTGLPGPAQGGAQGLPQASLTPYQQQISQLTGKADAELTTTIDSAADKANASRDAYGALDTAISNFNKVGSPGMADLQQWARDHIPGVEGGQTLEYKNIIDGVGAQMMNDVRQRQGMTRMTDTDVNLIKTQIANARTNPQAAHQLIGMYDAMLQRDQQVQQQMSWWLTNVGGLSDRNAQGQRFQDRLSAWKQQYPLFPGGKLPTIPQQQQAPAAPSMPASGVPR